MKEKILNFIENSKWFWVIAAVVGLAIGILCQETCSAQQVTNYSKPLSMGTFSTTGDYTITWYQQCDTGYNKNRTVTEVEWGNEKLSISYPLVIFNNVQIPLTGSISYPRISDPKKFHKWVIRAGRGYQELLIDNFLISKAPHGTRSNNAQLVFSSSSDIDRLSAMIQDFTFSNTYDTTKHDQPAPPIVYDYRNYVTGYVGGDWTNAPSFYNQLVEAKQFIKPVAAGTPKIHPMLDFIKAGGEADTTLSRDSIIKAGTMIAKKLVDLNGDFRVIQNTQDYIAYKDNLTSLHGAFNKTMIDLANVNLQFETRVDCSLSQLDGIAGHPALTRNQTNAMLPNEPITSFDNMAAILNYHYSTIQSQLLRPIKYVVVDNEQIINKWLDTLQYAKNPACKAAKEATGLSWWDYCSSQYTKACNRMYDGIRAACPGVHIVEYDVNSMDYCNNYYDAKFQYRIGLNTDRMGTDQLYPRMPVNLIRGGLISGDMRGITNYYMTSIAGQIKLGYKLNTPFYGMGYTGIPEQDINPTLIIGAETFCTVAGSPTGYPSIYIEGTQNPEPKAYANQFYTLTVAQAACAPVWDIIMNGDPVPGDRTQGWLCFNRPSYLFNTGDYETLGCVRRLGSRYAIGMWHGSATNVKSNFSLTKQNTGIWLHGKYLPLAARAQCSVYIYDETLPVVAGSNPKIVNSWVKVGMVNRQNYVTTPNDN